MPFLRFHATDAGKLAGVSRKMTDEIQRALDCPREHIVLEVIHAAIIADGEVVGDGWPFVEISWFERSPEMQDLVARIVSDGLREAGYQNSDVHFYYLNARNYYENGESIALQE